MIMQHITEDKKLMYDDLTEEEKIKRGYDLCVFRKIYNPANDTIATMRTLRGKTKCVRVEKAGNPQYD